MSGGAVQGPDDIRAYFETEFLGAWDLAGEDRTVEIARVTNPTLRTEGGSQRKPVICFRDTEKKLPLNKTNMKTIVGLYGTKVREWIGKRITLYPTKTKFAGKTVDAIRVRPTRPEGPARGVASRPVDPDMRARQNAAAGRREEPHPATPIAEAKTADELLDAIGHCAAWLVENHERAWPKVEARCEELGLDVEKAVEAVSKATHSEGAADGAP